MRRMNKRYLSFLPVPALIVIMAVLEIVVKPSLFYEPTWLLPVTNTLFVTIVFFIVAYIAMRNYKATSRIQILLLGGGVLAFGIGGVIAGLVRSVPGTGANLNVTIYNTGALIGAVFHFAAALILLAGISPEVGSKRKDSWLALSYVGATVFIALFSMASLKGLIPPFFIQGVGPTALRQWVLGAADILFAFSFFIFMGLYLKNGEVFLYWYALALALTSISLTAFFIQSAVGSPVGWAGRFSQYLGGIYFLTSIVTAKRSARIRKTSFDNVLTASLSPAEEKFRALAEHSPDIIARFDREMKHAYINQAGLRLYGKPADSIIGKTLDEARLPGADASLLKDRIQKVFETTHPVEVERYIAAENGPRFYQSRCVPEFGADGTVANVLVVSHDLTERKQAEEALRQSEQRWATTLASIGDAVIATDVEGRITFMNAVAEGLTGWTLPEASRKPVKEVLNIIDEQTRKEVDNPVTRVLQAGNALGLANHTILIRKDGTEVPIDDSGAPIKDESGNTSGVVIVFRDITERRRTEEALQAHRQLIETVVNHMPAAVNLIRGRDLRLQLVNPAYQAIAPEKDMLGKTLDELWPETGQDFRALCHHVLATGEPYNVQDELNTIRRRPDGPLEPVYFSWSLHRVRLPGDEGWGILNTAWETTARKQAEEALRKAHDELEKRVQERTSELSEAVQRLRTEIIQRKRLEDTLRESENQVRFFASQCLTAQETERKRVAGELHDSIAASLSAIKIRIEKIAEDMKQGNGGPESLRDLGSMVSQVNNDVRRIMADLRPSILDDLGIIAAMKWFCREYQKTYSHISVENQIGISEPEVPDSLKTPIFRISQEAMNNIAKYSHASLVNLILRKEDDKILLKIQDNGHGFHLDTVRKGMGLSTMRERAQLSGGSFELESAIGKGTIVRVSWPL